jgi:hypothetical protein
MFRKLFYPNTCIPKFYSQYLGWSFVSNLTVGLEVAWGTHCTLEVLNTMHDSELRTWTYLGKDIFGQLGALGYLSKMSALADADPKRFTYYAHLLQQGGFLVVFCTPCFDSMYYLPMASVANLCSNIAFVGFGAVNAKCTQGLAASQNNWGDIYGKPSVANTLASTIGMGLGLLLLNVLPDAEVRLWFFPALALVRVGSFSKALRGLI